jgi:hypothetical protein
VHRTIQELKDHYVDIELDALNAGAAASEAGAIARSTIGDEEAIASAAFAARNLLVWSARWPRSARYLDAAVYYTLLPAAPFAYCAAHGSVIARWSVSASLGALFTGGLLLSMHWALLLG